ncbi:MAG: hypothetical protein INR73_10165 [Williamsia sp.]|nr:hypothetical protein [Williamsia sp.]
MNQVLSGKKVAVLVGGSDLFSGLRGISAATTRIKQAIKPWYNDVLAINYNYFLDFGKTLITAREYLQTVGPIKQLVLYGYSKGGEVALELARSLEQQVSVQLLVTIDIANGPWSDKINRSIPANVEKVINVFQSNPNLLRSRGAAVYASENTAIRNIDLTGARIHEEKVTHSNIEMLMAHQVIGWLRGEQPVHG